jgi:hypothetical protein
MTNLEEGIATALRERAEGEVDVRGLIDAATARGVRRLRARRRIRAAGGGLVALAVAGGMLLASARWESPHGPGNSAAGTPSVVGATTPSAAPTAFPDLPRPPLVSQRTPTSVLNKLIGREHDAFHLDLSDVPGPVTQAQWSSFQGWERLIVESGSYEITAEVGDVANLDGPLSAQSQVRFGTDVALLSQADGMAQLRWQPALGVWAVVSVNGTAATVQQVAGALRLDRAYRCGVPFRLPVAEKETLVQGCTLTVNPLGTEPTVTVGTPWWSVTVMLSPSEITPTTTVGSYGADVTEHTGDGGKQVLEIDLAVGGGQTARFTAEGKYIKQEIMALAAGYQQVAPYDQPQTWTEWGAPGSLPEPDPDPTPSASTR